MKTNRATTDSCKILPGFCLLLCSLLPLGALAQEAEAPRLVGGVEHSERLSPIDEQEALGAAFQESAGAAAVSPKPSPINPNTAPHPSRAAAVKSTKAQTAPQAVKAPAVGSKMSAASQYRANQIAIEKALREANSQTGKQGQTASSYRDAKLYYRNRTPVPDKAMDSYRARLHEVLVANINAQPTTGKPLTGKTTKNSGAKVKVKVPFWLSGYWQRQETNELSRVELPSGRKLAAVGRQVAKVTDVFGTYKDKKGQVWMSVPLGNTGVVDRGSALDCHQVRKYELVITGPDTALVKVQACHFVVDKRNRRLLQAYQDEEFNEYKLVSTGLVRTLSSVKVFDQQGLPKMQTRAVSMEKRFKTI